MQATEKNHATKHENRSLGRVEKNLCRRNYQHEDLISLSWKCPSDIKISQ